MIFSSHTLNLKREEQLLHVDKSVSNCVVHAVKPARVRYKEYLTVAFSLFLKSLKSRLVVVVVIVVHRGVACLFPV